MKKTLIYFGLIAIAFVMGAASCEPETVKPSSDLAQQKQTEVAMQDANRQVGIPAIVNFQEKKLMKQIYELRDQENLVCYAYLFNRNDGTIGQFLGKCLGYGIPYSTQFSNPMKILIQDNSYDAGDVPYTVPQAEPNGLFMPEGLNATWLLLLDAEGKPHPTYVEPEIIVSPIALH